MSTPPRSILIINQPWSNHGDEAAHKGLVRMLRRRFPAASITALAFSDLVSEADLAGYRPDDVDNLEYVCLQKRPSVAPYRRASILSIELAKAILRALPGWRPLEAHMQSADLIVSSPSGVDLGPYRTWLYLALLLLAVESGKPTAIYSISFGPLPDATLLDRRFSALALDVLRSVGFLSLREAQSQELARSLDIPFVAATDTAFIDETRWPLPDALRSWLTGPYVIVVPNELNRWHVAYRSVAASDFEELYHSVIACALATSSQVVLLPQLFANQNDELYFERLRSRFDAVDRERILVVPDHYPVEIHKTLVADAEMVVAARYHAIIFSLIQATPFLALSYEHKIESHLAQAGLMDYMVRLEDMSAVDISDVAARFDDIWQKRELLRDEIRGKADGLRATAQNTAEEFARRFGSEQAPGGAS